MAYRSSTTNTGTGATDPSTTVPSGVQIGDIVILAVNTDGTTIALGFPAGFTVFSEVEVTLDGQTISAGWKRLTAEDAGSYTVTSDSTLDWVCQAAAFSGRDPELPPVISTDATNNSANASPVTVTANGVTAVDGDDLCWIGSLDRSTNAGTATFAAPTDYTERQDTLLGWACQSVATRDNVSAGATGTIAGTATLSTGTSGWAAWTIRIPEDDGITQPALREAGALSANASGTTITTTIPSSAAADDIMVLALMCNGSTTFSTPTDWTLLGTSIESNANQSTEWFWKRHDGSESNPASTTSATLSGTVGGYGRIYAFSGCTTSGDPFEDVTMAGSPTTDNNPDTAAIDTTDTWRLAVSLLMVDDDNTWSSGNPPSGWTSIGRVSSTTGGDCMMDGIYQLVPTASTVAAATIGTMSAADYWRSITFGLIPATASGDATVSATTIATTTALPAPTVQTGSTVAATAIVTTAALPKVVIPVVANAVVTTTAMPAPTLHTGSTVAATAIAATTALPAPTVQTGSTVTPATIVTSAALPAPTVSTGSNATVAATSIATVTALPAPTVQTGSTVAGVTIATTTALPAPTVQTGSTVTPLTVATTAALPAPTVSVGSNATVSATSIVTVTAMPAPVLSTGSTVTAITVATVTAMPAPTVTVGGNATITAVTIATTTAMPAPSLSTGQRVNPPVVATTTAMPAPTVSSNATIIAVTIATAVSMPVPTFHTGSTIAASVIATVAAMAAPFLPTQVTYGTGGASSRPVSSGQAGKGTAASGNAGSSLAGSGRAGRG